MKATLQIFLTITFALSFAWAETKNIPKDRPYFPPVPKLKQGEYAIFIEKNYQIFQTKTVDELELETSCLKSGKPSCEAFQASKTPNPTLKEVFHPAANHCEAKGGRNLIALDKNKDEYNFCRFKDNSMVNAWSLYLKQNPKKTIK